MAIPTPPPGVTAGTRTGGLLRSRRPLAAARGRNTLLGDGGGTGKGDNND